MARPSSVADEMLRGGSVQLVAAVGGAMTTMRPLYMPMLQL
jgi:hypothetical protein